MGLVNKMWKKNFSIPALFLVAPAPYHNPTNTKEYPCH